MPLLGTRPIPWKQLIGWAIGIGAITNLLVLAIDYENYNPSVLVGSLIGGLGYLLIGALLASRTGWQPPQFGRKAQQARAARAAERNATAKTPARAAAPSRSRPAPTSRTNLTNRRTPPKRR